MLEVNVVWWQFHERPNLSLEEVLKRDEALRRATRLVKFIILNCLLFILIQIPSVLARRCLPALPLNNLHSPVAALPRIVEQEHKQRAWQCLNRVS